MKKLAGLLIGVVLLVSCGDETETAKQFSGEALGTTYSIQYFTDSDLEFERAMDSIIGEINNSMSTYTTKSDISRINRGDTTVVVDKHFQRVFNASRKIYMESSGFFDPTVGSLVNAYGFGPDKPLKEIDSSMLDSLRSLVGFNKLNLRANNTITKQNPGIFLDFNAIAKGYAIDVIAEYLRSNNVSNYLIELGGELRAEGINLNKGSEWIVGIDDPLQNDGQRELYATLKLKDAAMATSGNYRKYRTDSVSGQRYVHTIDPLSGKAEKSNLLSASVLVHNCMLADGYATAFMAMGLERSKEMLDDLNGVEAYFLFSKNDGETQAYSTPGFKSQLVD